MAIHKQDKKNNKMNQQKYNWGRYIFFCSAYGLKPFKGISIKLFRMWLGLKHGQVLDIRKTIEFLISKK